MHLIIFSSFFFFSYISPSSKFLFRVNEQCDILHERRSNYTKIAVVTDLNGNMRYIFINLLLSAPIQLSLITPPLSQFQNAVLSVFSIKVTPGFRGLKLSCDTFSNSFFFFHFPVSCNQTYDGDSVHHLVLNMSSSPTNLLTGKLPCGVNTCWHVSSTLYKALFQLFASLFEK